MSWHRLVVTALLCAICPTGAVADGVGVRPSPIVDASIDLQDVPGEELMILSVGAGFCVFCRATTPIQARVRAGTNLTGPSAGTAPGSAFDAAALVGVQTCSLHSCAGVRVGGGAQYARYEDDFDVYPARDVSLPTGFLVGRLAGEVYQVTFGLEVRIHFLASTDPEPQRVAAGLYAGYRF